MTKLQWKNPVQWTNASLFSLFATAEQTETSFLNCHTTDSFIFKYFNHVPYMEVNGAYFMGQGVEKSFLGAVLLPTVFSLLFTNTL